MSSVFKTRESRELHGATPSSGGNTCGGRECSGGGDVTPETPAGPASGGRETQAP